MRARLQTPEASPHHQLGVCHLFFEREDSITLSTAGWLAHQYQSLLIRLLSNRAMQFCRMRLLIWKRLAQTFFPAHHLMKVVSAAARLFPFNPTVPRTKFLAAANFSTVNKGTIAVILNSQLQLLLIPGKNCPFPVPRFRNFMNICKHWMGWNCQPGHFLANIVPLRIQVQKKNLVPFQFKKLRMKSELLRLEQPS